MMETNNEVQNGSGDKTLDNLVIIMAGILFFGTAQVMSTHAPRLVSDIVGFDARYLFGVIAAICVEWGALRLHFNPYAQANPTAKWVKWILLGLSGLCQVYNAALETGNMASLSETLKIGFTWVVPNIPLLFIVLMFWIGTLGHGKRVGMIERITNTGIKHMLPSLRDVWEGKHGANSTEQSFALDVDQQTLKTNTNGKAKTKVNP
jgi:hypothetical protein